MIDDLEQEFLLSHRELWRKFLVAARTAPAGEMRMLTGAIRDFWRERSAAVGIRNANPSLLISSSAPKVQTSSSTSRPTWRPLLSIKSASQPREKRCMRTTLDIDDDVLSAAKERARREKKTVGQVISDLARRALTAAPAQPLGACESKSSFGFRPFPKRGGLVTNEMIDGLREEDAY